MSRLKLFVAALSCLSLAAGLSPARSETAKVRIGLQYGLVYLPIMIAHSEGYFAKNAQSLGVPDLDVSLNRFSGSTAINEALLSNSVDMGAFGLPGLLIAWEKTRGRQHVKALAGLSAITYYVYANKPNLKSLADFTDQDKIAVPAFNSPQAILLRVAAEKFMGSAAKANALMVSMPHPEATTALLSGAAISGYFSTPPFSQMLARDARVHSVLTSTAILGQEASAAALGTTQGFADDNPKVTRAILAGMEDAVKLIKDNPKRAAEIYIASEPVKLSVEEVQAMMTDGSITYDVVPHGIMAYARFMQQQGMMKVVPAQAQDVVFPLLGDRTGD